MMLVSGFSFGARPHRPAQQPPSLAADFLSGSLGGLTLTRAGAATCVDAAGVMQVMSADQPRFDHDPVTLAPLGLLIEGAATNLYISSDAPPTNRTLTVTAQPYTLSFWGDGTLTLTGAHAGAITGSGANTRSVVTFTPAAGSLNIARSGTVTGVQVEAGAHVTSYIPTTTATVTRAADVLAPYSLAPVWAAAGAVGGTILMDLDADGPTNTTRGYLWNISDAGLNRLALRGWNQGVSDDACKIVGGDGTANTDTTIVAPLRGRNKIAAAYTSGAAPMVSLSGAAAVTSARSYLHGAANSTVQFGGGFFGHLRSIRIYRAPMTAAQLQSLTL